MRGPETTEDAFFSLPLDSSAHHLHLSPALTTFARVFDFGLAFDLRAPAPARSDLRPEGVVCPFEGCVGVLYALSRCRQGQPGSRVCGVLGREGD